MAERDLPHMPNDHNVLMGKIRAFLRADETLTKSEAKLAIMLARNLPLNVNDPCIKTTNCSRTEMPRKIRALIRELERAGFTGRGGRAGTGISGIPRERELYFLKAK